MNQSVDGAWYFSRDGQQSGPLTYAELKEKADEGLLKPRTDLVWKEGLAEWKPVGEIEGLFERRESAVTLTGDSHAAVMTGHEHDDAAVQEGEWPGARRRSYLFVILLLPFLVAFLYGTAKATFPTALTPELWGMIEQFGPVVLAVIVLIVSLQRFANLGMSRWWYLGHFVPILNLWTGYRCFACPEGYASHKQMDGVGIFLAIIYWLVVVVAIAAVVFVIAILAGAAGSPEIQQQIKDALEQVRAQAEAAKAK